MRLERDGALNLRAFARGRALRIVPAYYAVVLLVALGLVPLYDAPTRALAVSAAYHLLFFQDYLPSALVVPMWSLGVEVKFYLLAPPLVVGLWRLGGHPRVRYALLLGLLAAPLAFRVATYLAHPEIDGYDVFFPLLRSPFHVACDGLVAGTLVAFIYHHRSRARDARGAAWGARLLLWPGLALLGLLLLPSPLLASIDWFDASLLYTLLALGFAAVTLDVASRPSWVARALSARWLFFFSKLSYSLYLVHMALIPVALRVAALVPGFAGWPPGAQFLLLAPTLLAVSSLGALLVHYAVEKPFLLLKDRRAPVPVEDIRLAAA